MMSMEEEKCNSSSNNGEAGSIVRLIDVSLEDDSLISVGNENENDGDDYFQLPPDPQDEEKGTSWRFRRRSGKCNLRKSLAWDKAFFTSAGVLEPEELSTIIHSGLTSIQEDVRKSNDSYSHDTTFTLFDDVRASIHKPSTNNTAQFSSASTNKMGSASRIKGKGFQKEAQAQKPTAGKNKQSSLRPHPPSHAQVVGRSGELKPSSLRPPKIAGRFNSSSASLTNNATLGTSRVKNDANTRKLSMGRKENVGGSKKPIVGDSNVSPRSTPSPISSSSSSVSGTKLELVASYSSHNRSGSTSSDSTDRSPRNSLRKNTTCRNLNSASNIKPPLRISCINKTEAGNAHPSVHQISLSKHSSNISPASSLDGWSSESSSSNSVNQHSSGSRKVIDVSSSLEGLYSERGTFQTDMQKHQRNQACVERKRTGLPSPCFKVSVLGSGSPTRLAATDVSRSSKPTGLRMPSPKFGYFDTEKSDEPTPTGFHFHPGVRSALRKYGAGVGNFHNNTVRAKAGKLQPARNMTSKSSVNVNPHRRDTHCTSSSRPTGESQELLSASPCVATTRTTGWFEDYSNISPKGTSPRAIQVICPSVTSISQDDNKLRGGSHLEVGNSGSLAYEGDAGSQNPLLNDMETLNEEASSTKTTGGCSGIFSELQNDWCPRTCVENWSKAEDVGESSNTKWCCINTYMNEGGDGGGDSVVLDTSRIGKRVPVTKVTKEHQCMTLEHNDLHIKTGSESPPWNDEMREVTETEGRELSLKGTTSCQASFVNDISILSRKLADMPIVEYTSNNQLSYGSGAGVHGIKIASIEGGEALTHDLGHPESNLLSCHDIHGKENSFCFDNQTDGLSKHTSAIDSSYMEEFTVKKHSSCPKFDGQAYSPDRKLWAINARGVLDRDQDVFPKVMLKATSHSHSTNSMEILPRIRTPLAVKPSLCNEVATSEFVSESTLEKVSTSSITGVGQTDI